MLPAPAPSRQAGRAPRPAAFVALAASGALAFAAHRAIADGRLGDRAGLALTAGVIVALALGALAALPRRAPRRAAAFALPLGLLAVAGAFAATGFVDASVSMEALLEAGGPAAAPATIVLGPGGRDVRFSGEIAEGAARRLATLLAAHPEVARIHLTSEGGLADEGQALGDVIAARDLVTYVPDYCVSACTLAFVRGRERLLEQGARLGFHAPYEQGLFGVTYRGDSADTRAAYVAAGLAPSFADAALAVDPSDIWYPTPDELLAAHAVTRRPDRYALPDSTLDGADTLGGARDYVSRSFPLARVLLKRSPRALDAIAGWYLDAYRAGRSEGDNADALTAIMRSAVAAGLSRADDDALPDLARLLDRALARTEASRTCAAIAGGADLLAAAGELEGRDAEAAAALFERALDGRHLAGLAHPASAQAVVSQAALAQAGPGGGEVGCAQWRERFARMMRHPSAGAALRAMLDAQAARSLALLRPAAAPRVGATTVAVR